MATRMQQRRGTASQWTSADPVLNAGEIGFESDTNKFKIGDGTNHWSSLDYFIDASSTANPSFGSSITFEGATANDFETTLAITDPTADRTLTLPDSTGTIATQEYVDSSVSGAEVDQSALAGSGIDWNAGTSQFDIAEDITVENITSNDTIDAHNLNVSGTLTVTGTESIISSNNLSIKDNVIYLNEAISKEVTNAVGNGTTVTYTIDNSDDSFAVGNAVSVSGITPSALNQSTFVAIQSATATSFTINKADTNSYVSGGTASAKADVNPDLGIIGAYNDGTYAHSGIVRDSSDGGKWKFFQGLVGEPGLNLDFTTAVRSAIQVGGLSATDATMDSISVNSATIGDVSNTELQYVNGVTSAIQTQIDSKLATATASTTYETIANVALKAPLLDPTFTGSVTLPSATSIGDVSATEIGYLDGVTSAIQTQLSAKITPAEVSNTYATKEAPTFTGTVVLPSTTSIGDVSATEIGYLDGVTSAIQTQINAKAPLENPTFTGTVSGVTKSHVGLENVDNTADASKPVSTATQTALDLKANLNAPTFTGTVSGVTKSMVDLGNVDNTSDANKPVSTATQTALDLKANLAGPALTGDASAVNLTISGNLTVNGTTTTLNSATLYVDDKNIELGSVDSPTDTTADGGGITLKGATDKTFNWVDATDSWTSSEHINLASGKDLKVNGTAVISSTAGGFIFTDGTQTKEGVPSRTPIIAKTDSYTLSALTERDSLIEVAKASATTITIPLNSAVAFPVGTSLDILQTSTGQVTIAGTAGVTVNATPGLKLRTQWSSCTLFKRAENTWVVFGDLTA
jgi:hypothetical protein